MQLNRPFVLSIAGLDPSAGAGLMADIKTFEALKVYGLGVASAITVQDDEKVYDVKWLSGYEIIKQAEILFNKFKIDTCKIGIMQDKATLLSVIEFLKSRNRNIKIIVDPVLKSSSGFDFYQKENLNFWKTVTEQITLITPNYTEMEILSEKAGILETAAYWSFKGNILLKGGHSPENTGTDYLFTDGKENLLHPQSQEIYQKHGSGCVLSSAITAYLALGFTLLDACKSAKKYTENFLNSNISLLGFHSL